MANSRMISVNFWKDSYVIDLQPNEKLLFLYFLTNHKTTLAGVYEISVREVAFDTDLEQKFISDTIQKFVNDRKIYFERNWLVLTNFIKHQRLNPSIIRGIEKAVEELPDWLREKIDLSHEENNQVSLFITDSPQLDNNLGTTTPQLKIIKDNINKVKLKKDNQTSKLAGDSEESSKATKQQYAKSMDKEREQETRVKKSFERKASKPTPANEVDPYAFREGKKS